MKIRKPAVAGMFYPGQPDVLEQDVQSMVENAGPDKGPAPKAMILPHAGYMYSGRVAASACQKLECVRDRIKRVVLVGPAHRVRLQGMAVPSAEAFETPLGTIRIDREAVNEITALPDVCVSDEAHRLEHSLEVQLPILQQVLGDFSIVPVVVGRASPESVARVIDKSWGGPETLVVISSDLSHFLDYDSACKMDRATCEAILARRTDLTGHQACGACAINGLMASDSARDLAIENVTLCNSWDTSGLNRERVVGYASFVMH